MYLGGIGSDGIPVFQPSGTDVRLDAILQQVYHNAKVEVLGGNVDESHIQQAIDEAKPKFEQLLRLSDRLEAAQTPAAQQSALRNMVQFIEQNGGNKMALYPYVAKRGFDESVIRGAGLDPMEVQRTADQIKAQTPASQADLDKLNTTQREQVEQLQAVIAELQRRIQELIAQQQQMNAQIEAQRDGMQAGPNTRPTEGLAPMANEAAPTGTVNARTLATLASVPIRG